MTLDLRTLRDRHPKLSETIAATHLQRVALGLQRWHRPGIAIELRVGERTLRDELVWQEYPEADRDQIDRHRVTEDGADAIALCVAHAQLGWTVLRRLQRGDFADWLLVESGTMATIALEVTGTDEGDETAAMRGKRAQLLRCTLPIQTRAACVVRYSTPRCTLEVVLEPPR